VQELIALLIIMFKLNSLKLNCNKFNFIRSAYDNFDTYASGTLLSIYKNWFQNLNSTIIFNSGNDGRITSNSSFANCVASYTGFQFNSNQYSQVTMGPIGAGTNRAQGPVVRMNGIDGYILWGHSSDTFIGQLIGGNESYVALGRPLQEGWKTRLEAIGTGSFTRLKAYYDSGNGWQLMTGDYNPSVYYNNGYPGIIGRNNYSNVFITDWEGGNL
jgi:hypothetical protein